MKYRFSIILCLALTAGVAAAQVAERKTLTSEGAKKVAAAAEAEAKKNGVGGAIAVVDDGGHLLVLLRLDDTFPAASAVSVGKARTAAMFRRPTSFFEDIVNKGRTTMVALSDFTPLQGGVPIEMDGRVIGAVGVSGAASAKQDDEIAQVAARALASTTTNGGSESSAVFYLGSEAVARAFVKGAPLIEVDEYKVHASHRDKAGEAEVHDNETDIIYVLEGTATFVTGGTVIDGRIISPGETRGRAIAGGEPRRLSPGDVIIVPRGTPHWFEKVDGVFNYYVVKVL